jgi:thiosulfate dehydrogenase (quinone) large subunit
MNAKKFAYLRIAFGFVWAVDAFLKWEPAFRDHLVVPIFHFNPYVFGIFLALVETSLALALIFGFLTRQAIILGGTWSLLIWIGVERFGYFWVPGASDLGTSAGYLLVFVALWIGQSWEELSLDKKLTSSTR